MLLLESESEREQPKQNSERVGMPPQNSEEQRKGAVKRKLEAMDTNDGASSKQAAEDVRPQVRA